VTARSSARPDHRRPCDNVHGVNSSFPGNDEPPGWRNPLRQSEGGGVNTSELKDRAEAFAESNLER
jgi:hypothetical protein